MSALSLAYMNETQIIAKHGPMKVSTSGRAIITIYTTSKSCVGRLVLGIDCTSTEYALTSL